jgi:hypothetical protein
MARTRRLLGITGLVVALTGCSGDDGDRRRAEAAAWCKATLQLEAYFDDRDGMRAVSAQISVTAGADWVDAAPPDIRDATERAASIMSRYNLLPEPPADLGDARKEIAEYAADHCDEPVDCIADVERNLRLPCING